MTLIATILGLGPLRTDESGWARERDEQREELRALLAEIAAQQPAR